MLDSRHDTMLASGVRHGHPRICHRLRRHGSTSPLLNRAPTAPRRSQPQVLLSMAIKTKSDQVLHFIATKPTPKSEVVNMEVKRRAADLAAPAVTRQYLQSQRMIFLVVHL